MQMNRFLVFFISVQISISAVSQELQYRKDDRIQNVKEDPFGHYQSHFSEIDIQKMFDMLGLKKFFFQIVPAFEKEYRFTIYLDEYVDGKKVNSRNIDGGRNVYRYPVDDSIKQKRVMYIDYIPNINVFTQNSDSTVNLKIKTYRAEDGIILKKKKNRDEWLPYYCRTYSKIEWKLNEEIPLLVYGSPWWDGSINMYRFCTAPDLSMDERVTKELYENSPHYYVLGYKVSE